MLTERTGQEGSVDRWNDGRQESVDMMERQQEGSTVLLGKNGQATEKKGQGNRKERTVFLKKKMQQEGRTVLLSKDRKATGSKDSVTGVR